MKISVIQSKKKFDYDPNDPGDYELALCRGQHGADRGGSEPPGFRDRDGGTGYSPGACSPVWGW